MKTTIYVANLLPIDAARIAQSMGLSGTTYGALGFGTWGVEPTTVLELGDASADSLASFLQELFKECPDEEAFYFVTGGIGVTIYRHHIQRDIPCTD